MPHPHTTFLQQPFLLFFKKNLCVCFQPQDSSFREIQWLHGIQIHVASTFRPNDSSFKPFAFELKDTQFFLLPFFEDCVQAMCGRFQIDIRKQKYCMILTALDQLASVKLRPRLIWVTTSPFTWMFGMMLGAYSFEYEQWCLLYEYGFQQRNHSLISRSKFFLWTLFLKKKGWNLAFYLRLTHFEVVQSWQRAAFEYIKYLDISTNPTSYFLVIKVYHS